MSEELKNVDSFDIIQNIVLHFLKANVKSYLRQFGQAFPVVARRPLM